MPQQQLPAAAAVLATEAALLLAAPAAAMHNTVHKLLLRQPALDTAGLPLFGRIMAGGASGLNSNSKSNKGGAGGVKGAAAVMAERQWLMRLLWLGLRVSCCFRWLFLKLLGSGLMHAPKLRLGRCKWPYKLAHCSPSCALHTCHVFIHRHHAFMLLSTCSCIRAHALLQGRMTGV
jgi:hypothetical protein